MAKLQASSISIRIPNKPSFPPGREKIVKALRMLLEKNDFNNITISEIARKAGVTEPLIYKYFRDKRDLLHQVMSEHFENFVFQASEDIQKTEGTLNKLESMIWHHINCFATDRILAKILLLEVRSCTDYYRSKPYKMIKKYSMLVLEVIEEGIRSGEIRKDLPPRFIRQVIFGGIEHTCLMGVVFNKEFNPDILTDYLCRVLFDGISSAASSVGNKSAIGD